MNAIISVSDKTIILDLAEFLYTHKFTIYSTGGTYEHIKTHLPHCNLEKISSLTKFPEILNGRVKTLSPYIYGGILADPLNTDHTKDMTEHNLPFFDVVVVNLYPFERVSKSTADFAECIENIDIGGVSLIRASSKNFKNTVLLSSPSQYLSFMENFKPTDDLGISFDERKQLAINGFKHTSNYDSLIYQYLSIETNKSQNKIKLKYGLNPQQKNSYLSFTNEKGAFQIINGILGYINVLDILNGWLTVMEVDLTLGYPAAISMKHTSLAGLAVGNNINENTLTYFSNKTPKSNLAMAFMKCRIGDPLSSFGDFICLSRKCDLETAELIKSEVCDGVAAPDFDTKALEILKQKKGGNFIVAKMDMSYYLKNYKTGWTETRTMYGVTLEQENNKGSLNLSDVPEEFETAGLDLVLSNIALKYAQSNNISIGVDGQIIGMGCGQQNRVSCVILAGTKATNWLNRQTKEARDYWNGLDTGLKRQSKVNMLYKYIENNPELFNEARKSLSYKPSLASDGFFPFSDNIESANKYGIKYIVQPGGSINDTEVKEACEKYGINMVLSGANNRMFFH